MTQVNTPPNLRKQIIAALNSYRLDVVNTPNQVSIAEDVFDTAIMPVLQKAMDNGALLVGRNTKDREPVHKEIIRWLETVIDHVKFINNNEETISKRKCLDVIYQFGDSAQKALIDARKIDDAPHS